MGRDDLGQLVLDFVAALGVGGALFLEVAQVDKCVQLFDFLSDLLADLHRAQLHQGRPADGLLHPQLTALHAAGQIDFAFARQQRNRAHFAQIHAYRIIGVNRFFGRMRSGKLFAIMGFLGVKEIRFLVERKPQRLMAFA